MLMSIELNKTSLIRLGRFNKLFIQTKTCFSYKSLADYLTQVLGVRIG